MSLINTHTKLYCLLRIRLPHKEYSVKEVSYIMFMEIRVPIIHSSSANIPHFLCHLNHMCVSQLVVNGVYKVPELRQR